MSGFDRFESIQEENVTWCNKLRTLQKQSKEICFPSNEIIL